MEWLDDAIVLSARPHGETALIVTLLTRARGRHAGLVHGQRQRAQLQPGTEVRARWRARLADNLGTFGIEPVASRVAALLDDPVRLAALASACALVEAALPERAPYAGIYDGLAALLATLPGEHWDAAYVGWELGLLGALGFGLDLAKCAVTGSAEGLAYVSPRSGRAVSLEAGAPYRDRLLPLPGFLIGRGQADPAAVLDGLALTGHFIERNLFGQSHRPPPPARDRYIERYRKMVATSASMNR